MVSSSLPSVLTMMTGICARAASALTCARNSRPFMFGMLISRKIRSTSGSAASFCKASWPSRAQTTALPGSISLNILWMRDESSITSAFFGCMTSLPLKRFDLDRGGFRYVPQPPQPGSDLGQRQHLAHRPDGGGGAGHAEDGGRGLILGDGESALRGELRHALGAVVSHAGEENGHGARSRRSGREEELVDGR